MTKGMYTCKICGRDFPLLIEEHYVAQDPQKVGAFANLVSTDRAFEFDAIDCPHCGCQNVLGERKVPFFADRRTEDNCSVCVHTDCKEDEFPCSSCCNNYMNHFKEKEESDNE